MTAVAEVSFAAVVRGQMKLVCAWCRITLREGSDPESKVVSHGICDSCAAIHFPERKAS